jgi:hypothetical protein
MLRQAFDRSRLVEEVQVRQRIETDKRRKRDVTRQRHDRERKDELEDRADADTSALAMAVATSPPATAQQIAVFEANLTQYETATVDALMENDRQMIAVQAQLDALLNQAFVMDDGRRVFRTEDGTQVFDEFGLEVTADELELQTIPDHHPTWEEFSPVHDQYVALQQERQALFEYQQQLDDARNALVEREITQAELEELQANLIEDMPDAVRARLPEEHAALRTKTNKQEVSEPSKSTESSGPSLDGLQGFAPPTPAGA